MTLAAHPQSRPHYVVISDVIISFLLRNILTMGGRYIFVMIHFAINNPVVFSDKWCRDVVARGYRLLIYYFTGLSISSFDWDGFPRALDSASNDLTWRRHRQFAIIKPELELHFRYFIGVALFVIASNEHLKRLMTLEIIALTTARYRRRRFKSKLFKAADERRLWLFKVLGDIEAHGKLHARDK